MSVKQFEFDNEMNEFEPESFENAELESADFERADPENIQFEAELTLAMGHVDPPSGFADRVLAQAAVPQQPMSAKVLMMPRRVQTWVGSAVAAALLIGAFGIQQQHERRQREEAAREQQQQLELALQIAGETLANVRAQVQDAGIRLGD